MDDRRVTFAREWLGRASREIDEFDRFFSAWMALVVAAQRLHGMSGGRAEEDTDQRRIVEYFKANRGAVLRAAETHEPELSRLAQRRGARHGDPIVDTGNPTLRILFGRFVDHYQDGVPIEDDDLVVALAEILNKLRDNVFHGSADYDDAEDRRAMALVNPLLLAILTEAETV